MTYLYDVIVTYVTQREQEALRKLEDDKMELARRQKQTETREMLDRSIREKTRKEARRMQEELAFDLRMLEQLLSESTNEATELQQRKVCGGCGVVEGVR